MSNNTKRLAVAPMMDWTDRQCRTFHRSLTKKAVLYSEMVTTGALIHGDVPRHLDFDEIQHPVVLQLGGSEPQELAASAKLAQQWGYDEVDLNCGCPSERVQRGSFGACLMADPKRVADCVSAMAEASGLPITVKHRIGIDNHDSYAELLNFVDTVAGAGCQRFIVHARKAWLEGLDPKQNRTVPPLRYDLVQKLKQERSDLILELNGGLESLESCQTHLLWADGVMVGRAAYHHPLQWNRVDQKVFNDLEAMPARASTVLRGILPHAERWCASGGKLWPIARHLVHLVEGVSGARHWRRGLVEAAAKANAGPQVLEKACLQLEERGL
jgi:tRNA-dihydrouridine synthase A